MPLQCLQTRRNMLGTPATTTYQMEQEAMYANGGYIQTPPPSPHDIPTSVEDLTDKTYATLQTRIKGIPGLDDPMLEAYSNSWQHIHPSNWTSQEVMDFIHYVAKESTPPDVIPDFSGYMFNNLSGTDLMSMTLGEFEARSPEFGRHFYQSFKKLADKSNFQYEPSMAHDHEDLDMAYTMDETFPLGVFDDGELSPTRSVNLNGHDYDYIVGDDFNDSYESGYKSTDSSSSYCPSTHCNIPDTVHYQHAMQQQDSRSRRGPGRPRKTLPDGQPKPHGTRGRKPGQTTKGNHLYEFVRDLLYDAKYNPSHVRWEDKESGVFRFVLSEKVAKLWGNKKNNQNMTYEKLSRAMRFCRTVGYFAALPKDRGFPKKLCFKFGPKAQNWQSQQSFSQRSIA